MIDRSIRAICVLLVLFIGAARAGPLEEAIDDLTAQFSLAQNYRFGVGVPKNYGEAAKWYRPLAQMGFDEAQFSLGVMYAQGGNGIRQNLAEAVKWYRE